MAEKNIAELSAAREKAIVKTSIIGILTLNYSCTS